MRDRMLKDMKPNFTKQNICNMDDAYEVIFGSQENVTVISAMINII